MSLSGRILAFHASLQTSGLSVLLPACMTVCLIGQTIAWGQDQDAEKEPVHPTQELVDQYEERVTQGEAEQVILECTRAIEADPNNFLAHLGRGIALNALKKYDEALKDFDAATNIEGREDHALIIRSQAYTHRSEALYEKRQYLDAVDSAYFALLELGDNPDAHYRRAVAYTGWNKPDRAIGSANRALNYRPDFAEAYSIRGFAYGMKRDYKRAIADQTKALEMNPGLVEAIERRAAAYLAQGDFSKAAQDVTAALAKDPQHPEALCDRSILYAIQGDMETAMADLDQALQADPESFRAYFQRGMIHLSQKHPEEALQAFNQSIELNGRFVAARLQRGQMHIKQKEYDQAITDLTEAIKGDPKLAAAYKWRSVAYKNVGKADEARADLNKLKELEPPSKKDKSKSKTDKKEDDIPTFQVVSKGVDPNRRDEAQAVARQIDNMVEANYKKYNIQPNPLTTDEQFVRRIYLDITGTIPTYPQTRRFLASRDPDKRAKLIDDLLGQDGYASHYFNYWADVLRYTDRLNGNVDGEPYRQWLKQSLAENKPWDQMVREMLTAEGLIWENPATGYIQRDANMPLDNMNNTVRIFLGTRIGCAQCHNHPFDRWTQKDFYQMAAFTYGTATRTGGSDKRFWQSNPQERLQEQYYELEQEEEERRRNYYQFNRTIGFNMMIVNHRQGRKIQLPKDYAYDDAKPGQVVEPKTLFGSEAVILPGETPQQAFARWLTEKENPRFARTIANRLWRQAFGTGQIEPVDDMTDHTEAENPELMNFLEQQMKDLDFDMKEYLRILFNTKTYQRQACFEEVPPGSLYHFPGPLLRRMTAEQAWDSFLTIALPDPDHYRELPASLKTQAVRFDLENVTAEEVLESNRMMSDFRRLKSKWDSKHKYKGVLLARASELPSPLPPNHFIRMFGQSDRELISASSTSGSVPQVLFMFNGPITHMLLEKDSTIYNNVMKKRTIEEGVEAVFMTILNRMPDQEDMALAMDEIQRNGPAGYGNVIWSLVNTREFLFIQ